MFLCGVPCNLGSPIKTETTSPIAGQKPGTSGLRKKTKVFMEPNYLANFIQSIFSSLPKEDVEGQYFVVGGDGRYFMKDAIKIIAEIAAGNGAAGIITGLEGLISTPAASRMIREITEPAKPAGGFILTASHNPGGIDNDFGVKYNTGNGAPALEALTDAAYAHSQKITSYLRMPLPILTLSEPGIAFSSKNFTVHVVDSAALYAAANSCMFDTVSIKKLIEHPSFSLQFDAMHGAAGPYAESILVEQLGATPSSLVRCDPLEDFGGLHPDPNLTYAEDLVAVMKPLKPEEVTEETPVVGFACDGDADRNMILGKGFFVTPSDSVAVIADYAAQGAIPYFNEEVDAKGKEEKVPRWQKGFARSFPTSNAIDAVAKFWNVPLHTVPTGWKFFGNLMDDNWLALCGEESFGTGSDHIREKDGLWAVMAWLNILAFVNKDKLEDAGAQLTGVKEIVEGHWAKYGRSFYTRYDYEEVDSEGAAKVIARLQGWASAFKEGKLGDLLVQDGLAADTLDSIKVLSYSDPVDGSFSDNQGMELYLKGGEVRVVVRLSGTGSSGATIRVYIEKAVAAGSEGLTQAVAAALGDVPANVAALLKLQELTGRDAPSVIT